MRITAGIVLLFVFVATSFSDEEFLKLATSMTKLTAALDAQHAYGNLDPNLSESEFIHQATSHDPSLLAPFRNYTIRAFREEAGVFVLACEKGGEAVLGDAGCTAALDQHYWQTSEEEKCVLDRRLVESCAD